MRRSAVLAGIAVVFCLIVAWLGGPALDVLVGLAFGWFGYLARVIPKARVAWDGVATGALCLGLFTVGMHRTLKWLHGEIQGARGAAVGDRRRWTFRWTAAMVTLIVVMFAVGMEVTGVMHQAGWLIASRGSLVEEKPRHRPGWGTSVDHLKYVGMGSSLLDMGPGPNPLPGRHHPQGKAFHGWMTEILPATGFVLGGELRDDLPWNDPKNSAYFRGIVPIYLNPDIGVIRSDGGYALSHYAGNVHVLGGDRASRRVAPGDAANTILAGEVFDGFKPWGDPTNLRDPGLGVNQVTGGFGGPSGSGANFLFLDGSVRFLKDTTPPDVLRRLSRPGPLGR